MEANKRLKFEILDRGIRCMQQKWHPFLRQKDLFVKPEQLQSENEFEDYYSKWWSVLQQLVAAGAIEPINDCYSITPHGESLHRTLYKTL